MWPVEALPFALGALWQRTQRYHWVSPDDWKRGRRLINELQVGLIMGCKNELLESQRQIYRLLDTALNGTTYTVASADPLEIEPAIPAVPPAWEDAPEPSALYYSRETYRSVDNALHGRDHTGYSDLRNPRQQLDDLIAAVSGQGNLDDEQLAQLIQIVGLLA